MLELAKLRLLCLLHFLHLAQHLRLLLLRGLLDLLHDLVSLLQHLVVLLEHLQLFLDDRLHQVLSDEHVAFLLGHHGGSGRLVPFFDELVQHPVDQQPHLYGFDVVYLLVEDLSERQGFFGMLGDEVGERLDIEADLVLLEAGPVVGGVEGDADLFVENTFVRVDLKGFGVLGGKLN